MRVVALGDGQVWAAGRHGHRVVVLRYDGARWAGVAEPGLRFEHGVVLGASGPDDVWVVAEGVARWDGARWRHVPSPGEEVKDIAVLGPRDVWAVFGTAKAAPWDGARWTRVALPAAAAAISAAPSGALWAVGFRRTSDGSDGGPLTKPAAMRWDGGRWSKRPSRGFRYCCTRIAPVGDGVLVGSSGPRLRGSWVLDGRGRIGEVGRLPNLPGKDFITLDDLAHAPGGGTVWAVGGIEFDYGESHRGFIARYR
jgi:hypothetical protein